MLTAGQTQITRTELAVNLALSGLGLSELAESLEFSAERLSSTLTMDDRAHPSDVWLLRDFLDQVIRDHGDTPRPWTVLKHHDVARQWFPIREVPPSPQRHVGPSREALS